MVATTQPLHGVMAEFATPDELVAALKQVKAAGYTKYDAYGPLPLHEALDAMDVLDKNPVPLMVLIAGIVGGLAGFGLATFASVISYPIDVGGRPLLSWPAFIPPTFETTVLFASLTAVFGMIALNGLPQPYHPVFNVERFALASADRFFLCIEATDPKFEVGAIKSFLAGLGPYEVSEVES
jgi:hypothetical protein